MDNTLTKINALFAKAESTDSPHEAEALLAKAQELMIKHAIDEGMLNEKKEKTETIEAEAFYLGIKGGRGNRSLLLLLTAIGEANSVKVYRIGGQWHLARLAGYPSDVRAVKTMFTALKLQLFSGELQSREMKPDYVHGTTWRVSFYEGFSHRMSAKLYQARRDAETQAREQYGAGSDLVLVSKEEHVTKWAEDNLRLSKRSFSWGSNARSGTAYAAGTHAADRAQTGGTSVTNARTAALQG